MKQANTHINSARKFAKTHKSPEMSSLRCRRLVLNILGKCFCDAECGQYFHVWTIYTYVLFRCAVCDVQTLL